MNFKGIVAGISLIVCSFLAFPAYANVITEGYAYPFNGSWLGNVYHSQTTVGYSGHEGSLVVNTESTGNAFTTATTASLIIGYGGGSEGIVTVEGNGASGSAQLITTGYGISNADGGTGTLNISNGGVVEATEGNVYLGRQGLADTPGTATTTIDGQGSILRAQQGVEGTWGRDGGRIYVGFDGESDSVVNITNGGLMEALSGNVGDTYDDGSIWIGSSADSGSSAIVNVDGAGSAIKASTYIWVGSDTSDITAQLNITNGASVEVTDGHAYFGDASDIDMAVATFPVNSEASVTINGFDSYLQVDQLQIGGTSRIAGYTADGTPITFRQTDVPIFGGETDFQVGDQITDQNGNLLFDREGNPVLAITYMGSDIAPSTILDENGIDVKDSGSVVVENNGALIAQTVNISQNASNATSYNGQGASLTLDYGFVMGDVNVYEDGILDGIGAIDGSVTVNGGTVAPGFSPGDIFIFGDLTVEAGTLEIEVESESVYDRFWVDGDIYFGDDAQINLIFSYEEQNIVDFFQFFSAFNPLDFGDGFNPVTNIALDVLGIDDFSIDLRFLDTVYTYTANGVSLNDDTGNVGGPVPEPTTMLLFGLGLLGIAGVNRRRD